MPMMSLRVMMMMSLHRSRIPTLYTDVIVIVMMEMRMSLRLMMMIISIYVSRYYMYVILDDDDDCVRMCYDELMMMLFCIFLMCTCYLKCSMFHDNDESPPCEDPDAESDD